VSALLLSAVGGTRGKSGITLAADHLVAIVLSGQHLEGWLNSTTTQTKNQVQSRLLLDVIVAQCSTIFQLLTSEDKTLLIRWDSFLVLDLGLDVIDCVRGLHIQGDGLTGQGLDEDLHDVNRTRNDRLSSRFEYHRKRAKIHLESSVMIEVP
jgi:hypothetical protein